MRRAFLTLTLIAATLSSVSVAQAQTSDDLAFKDLTYRMVGPFRGGRSTAVAGFISDADRWIMGTTGGGIWATDDNGGSWSLVTDGIPGNYPVRTVREDPVQEGLLFAGTEWGLFVSLDGGRVWQSLQQNLPITPVTGMRAAHDDLIISTQARSFWILDDITPLREIAAGATSNSAHLFTPRDAWRVNRAGGGSGLGELEPKGIPQGGLIHYWLAEDAEEVRLEVLDPAGALVRGFSSDSAAAAEYRTDEISSEAGLNRTAWDLLSPGPDISEDAVIWGYTGGVKAPPGTYALRLTVDGEVVGESTLNLRADPRLPEITQADYEEQLRVGLAVRDSIDQVTEAIETLISVREQVESVVASAAIAERDRVLHPQCIGASMI